MEPPRHAGFAAHRRVFTRAKRRPRAENNHAAHCGAGRGLASQPRLGQRRNELPAEDGEIRTLLVAKTYRLVYEILAGEQVVVLQVLDLRQNNTFYR